MWLLDRLTQIIVTRFDVGEGQEHSYVNYLPSLLGASQSVSGMLETLQRSIWLGLFGLLLLLILRFILRKEWLAAAGLVAVGLALVWSVIPAEWGVRAMVISLFACSLVIAVGTLIRFGLLAIVIGFFCSQLLNWPITTDTSAWYFQTGLGAILVILAIAGYGFYTSLGKRPILREA
jgi:hypothetical protein